MARGFAAFFVALAVVGGARVSSQRGSGAAARKKSVWFLTLRNQLSSELFSFLTTCESSSESDRERQLFLPAIIRTLGKSVQRKD